MKTGKDSERISELKHRLAESVRICVREELLETSAMSVPGIPNRNGFSSFGICINGSTK